MKGLIILGYRLELLRDDDGSITWNIHILGKTKPKDDTASTHINSVIDKLELFLQELKLLNPVEE